MFGNFTEETCTGTAATLTLTGVTTDASGDDNLPFSASFADGDTVSITLNDSAGVIKIAGIYTYNYPANTFTRNDTWNWNGTVVDDNPATNITLSGGTHVIRCDVVSDNLFSGSVTSSLLTASTFSIPDNMQKHDAAYAPVVDRAFFAPAVFLTPRIMTSFALDVQTLATSSNTRQALYSANSDGGIGELLEDSGNVDVSTTGLKVTNLATPRKLSAGRYWFGVVSDNATVRWRSPSNGSTDYPWGSPYGVYIYSTGRPNFPYLDAVTAGFPTAVTPTNYANSVPITAGFK